jgi:anti-sigma regulatory factor (Ser/Thr protein kinase)
MTDRSSPAPGGFEVAIPGHDRFLPAARAVAERAARLYGCSADQASGVGEALAVVVSRIIQHARHNGSGGEIVIRFSTPDLRLEIDVGFDDGEAMAALERGLAARADDKGLHRLRRAIDRVEFGREDGRAHCRLSCRTAAR